MDCPAGDLCAAQQQSAAMDCPAVAGMRMPAAGMQGAPEACGGEQAQWGGCAGCASGTSPWQARYPSTSQATGAGEASSRRSQSGPSRGVVPWPW
eukprot:scaffold1151_cov126-Isochrysis_galbana.AAC.20